MVNLYEYNSQCDIDSEKTSSKKLITKKSKSNSLTIQIKGVRNVVQNLENSLSESEVGEKHLLRHLQADNIKHLSIVAQLNEARKENKQLLNILQQKCLEKYPMRSHTDYASPCSTMSMVNLQYNYEELLSNYGNLLKLLATKDKDMERLCIENEDNHKKASDLAGKLITCESLLKKIGIKYMQLKEKKEAKIVELKSQNKTLMLVHNQLVSLLNKQYMESDNLLSKYLQNESIPQKALLLQEVQRANKLYHENVLLKRELACLKSSKTIN